MSDLLRENIFLFFCLIYSDASEDKRELNCEFSLLPDFPIVQRSQITFKKFKILLSFQNFFQFLPSVFIQSHVDAYVCAEQSYMVKSCKFFIVRKSVRMMLF